LADVKSHLDANDSRTMAWEIALLPGEAVFDTAVVRSLLAEIDRLNVQLHDSHDALGAASWFIEGHWKPLPEQHHPAEVGQPNRRQHTNADHDSGTAKLNRDEGILPPGQS
jgi:hypothetical protein